jgi:prepilin-type N-terminal cleavage/methylation domain-containing protein
MKSPTPKNHAGFSLPEMFIALSIASVLFAAIVTTSVSLQRSFHAVDSYFATHIQQVRIMDYLGRDVKRGLNVTTSVDRQSVTVKMPKYLIKEGDAEALANPALIGTARTPTIIRTQNGPQVHYGTSVSTVVYAIKGLSILRTEDGEVTTIASSTDQLIAKTTNVELANTQYTNTTVTFRPLFTKIQPGVTADQDTARLGTTVCATAYLRNRRRDA